MKLLLLSFIFLCSLTLLKAQETTKLDSLETTLENLSWKELDSIGKKLRSKRNYPKSEVYLKKALQIAEKQNGKDSLYALSSKNLAILYRKQGLYKKAEPLYIEAKDVQEKIFGKEHRDYANSCNSLGILYKTQGLYEKAELLYIEAKDIREKVLGKEHRDYAMSCNNIARLYRIQGFYHKAEPLIIEAKDIQEKTLGKEHRDYARSCNSLGILYRSQGLYQKAEPLYIEAKNIQEKTLGKEHPDYASSCNSLGILYRSQGLYQKAEPLYIETKDIYEKIFGKEHPLYADPCNNLAILYHVQGLYQKAEPLYIEAKNINEKIFGKEHSDYAGSCYNLAVLYSAQKLYQKAEPLYIEAKNIYQKTLGKEHPDYAQSCSSLASLYGEKGLYQKAEPLYTEALQNKKNQIKLLFPTLSETEKQAYFSSISTYFSSFTDFVTQYYYDDYPKNNKISSSLFNQQLFTKGIIFSSTQKMKNQILSSNDTVLINQYDNWKQQKEDYITLIQTPPNKRDSTFDLIKTASQINELEREISKKSGLFKSNTNQKEYNWQDVKQTLSKDEALIEIIRLVRKDIQETPKDTLYVVLIVTEKTQEAPELVFLEKSKEMEKGDFYFYQNTTKFQLEDNESYDQYWKPIQDKLDSLSNKGYSKIYFSPDGVYHKINLNGIKNPKTNKYLLEEQNIQLITSSRDLIERKTKEVENIDLSKKNANYKVYLLGYPSYNMNEKNALKVDNKHQNLNGLQRIIGRQTLIPILEGTKVETNKINDLLDRKSISTTLFQNNTATEENIKALKSPTILHIATHGFFINEIPENKVTTIQEAEDRNLLKNPFFRSGLLLAGCQNPQTGQEDGILSAEEAMNLNLEGTELVVLSACETGLGDIHNGEGVYGLQRAFRQAGAKTIIMSLWKVSDEATQLLMTTFYKNLLRGKSKREAFKIAQLKLKKKYNEPFYWGAFVMVGE